VLPELLDQLTNRDGGVGGGRDCLGEPQTGGRGGLWGVGRHGP
jgi:hypothetical protein